MVTTASAWLLPALPFLAFLLTATLGRWLPGQGAGIAIVLTGAGAVLWAPLLGALFVEGPQLYQPVWFTVGGDALHVSYIVDPLAALVLGVVLICSTHIQVYALGYMGGEARFGWFFAVVALFTAAMLGLVLSASLLTLYVCWEVVGLCSYLLIGFWFDRPAAVEAAKKAFITTRVGDVGLLIGILLLFRATGTLDIPAIVTAVQQGAIDGGTLTAAAILVLLGAFGKSGQFPLHVWLPDAMEGPTPVSALIHAATMVTAGVYLVARLFPIFEAAPVALAVVAAVGLISAAGASLLALVQTDIKRILAYSTISQLGLMFAALGTGFLPAAIFHLTTHAAFKALLFLAAGSVIHGTTRQKLDELGGLRRSLPVTAFTMLAGAAALAGVPLTSGYFSKDEILLGLLDRSTLLFVATLAVSALTAFYTFRLWVRAFLGPDQMHGHAHESPAVMLGPLVAFTVPSLLLGFLLFIPFGPSANIIAFLAGETGHPPAQYAEIGSYYHAHHEATPNGLVLGTSAAAALAGAGAAWAVYRSGARIRRRLPGAAVLERGFFIDALYRWLTTQVVMRLSAFFAWFDRRWVNDAGVNGAGRLPAVVGGALRTLQTGNLSTYALAIVAGMALIAGIILWSGR
ncbi:MAG: NADH-quinone oxidoreductase subunit L [Dehalococcoidia bacterium]|nr:MAG: NADH-quinone oxidoreductase subunit L [Dehalococcoidia bacterium]